MLSFNMLNTDNSSEKKQSRGVWKLWVNKIICGKKINWEQQSGEYDMTHIVVLMELVLWKFTFSWIYQDNR